MRSLARRTTTTDLDVVAELRALRARVAALERDRQHRNAQKFILPSGKYYSLAEDRPLREALASAMTGRPGVTATELLDHAAVDAALATALDDASISTPTALGMWLARAAAWSGDGIIVDRARRRWIVTRTTSATSGHRG